MRTEDATEPITPAATQRQPRWPDDAPIPEVGDYWDPNHADRWQPPPVAAMSPQGGSVSPAMHLRQAPAASAALVSGLAALALIPAAGIGGIVGLIAIILGATGIRQINRNPTQYHGNGRAVSAIILGTIAALIGIPVLLLVLLLTSAV
ncbi:MAG: DUF4190 domain-containing protein [Gordonia sp. (in: high G+C Gram-positive bacteria)]